MILTNLRPALVVDEESAYPFAIFGRLNSSSSRLISLHCTLVDGSVTAMYAPDGAFPSPAGLIDSTVQTTQTVSPDSLERPAITYHAPPRMVSVAHTLTMTKFVWLTALVLVNERVNK